MQEKAANKKTLFAKLITKEIIKSEERREA
jgi:hypothetical protein